MLNANYRLEISVTHPGSEGNPELQEISSTSKEMLVRKLHALGEMYAREIPVYTTCAHCKADLMLEGVPWLTIYQRSLHVLDCCRCGKPNEVYAVAKCAKAPGPGRKVKRKCHK